MTRINGDELNPEGNLDEEDQGSLTESLLADVELSSEAGSAPGLNAASLRTQMKGAECEAA